MEFDHVGIRAYDVDELAEWYKKVFGFKINNTIFKKDIVGGGNEKHTFLEKYGVILDIFSDGVDSEGLNGVDNTKATTEDQHLEHLAFATKDIKADYDHLIANNVYIIEKRLNLTEGKTQNIYCRDLNNNSIHIIQNDDDSDSVNIKK